MNNFKGDIMSTDHSKSTETNITIDAKDPKNEKLGLPRAPNQKPFVRHDASYVCSVCKVKFFTKVDVEEHFLKHPLVDKV